MAVRRWAWPQRAVPRPAARAARRERTTGSRRWPLGGSTTCSYASNSVAPTLGEACSFRPAARAVQALAKLRGRGPRASLAPKEHCHQTRARQGHGEGWRRSSGCGLTGYRAGCRASRRAWARLRSSRSRADAAPDAWRRFTREARRRFRDLWRRAKAFKNGLSEEDKNLLKAAGVLVGAIVAVNVTNAIVGGRSSAPFA